LVRSQAIRESQSPPRGLSPSPAADAEVVQPTTIMDAKTDSCDIEDCDKNNYDEKKQPEIQVGLPFRFQGTVISMAIISKGLKDILANLLYLY
jgi:hypothetical protein